MVDQLESVRFRRVGSPLAPRILRMQGDVALGRSIEPATSTDGGSLSVQTRDPVMVGERVRIEIGLGEDADPVRLSALISDVRFDDGTSSVTMRVAMAHRERLAYVRRVLEGSGPRSPTRENERVEVDLEARAEWEGHAVTGRVRDLSQGGAFIETRPQPEVGTDVHIRIGGPEGTGLQMRAHVTWVRRGEHPGFGVAFTSLRLATSKALAALLRQQRGDGPEPD